jgi:hypothetical protein
LPARYFSNAILNWSMLNSLPSRYMSCRSASSDGAAITMNTAWIGAPAVTMGRCGSPGSSKEAAKRAPQRANASGVAGGACSFEPAVQSATGSITRPVSASVTSVGVIPGASRYMYAPVLRRSLMMSVRSAIAASISALNGSSRPIRIAASASSSALTRLSKAMITLIGGDTMLMS